MTIPEREMVNLQTPVTEVITSSKSPKTPVKLPLVVGLLAGVAASTCCVGPLVLLSLGVSGSWIGNLSAMEPFRPIFIALTLVFFGLAYRRLYRRPQACVIGEPCTEPANLPRQRTILWVAGAFVLVVISFPWYGPLLFD